VQLPSRTRTEVNAIYEEDLPDALAAFGVHEAYERGELRCAICEQALRDGGLGAARKTAGSLKFACGRLECIRTLSRERS
jgi:hypothetical protein